MSTFRHADWAPARQGNRDSWLSSTTNGASFFRIVRKWWFDDIAGVCSSFELFGQFVNQKVFNGCFKLKPFIQFFSILKNCLINSSSLSLKIQGLFTQLLNNKRKSKWFQDSKYLNSNSFPKSEQRRPVLFQTLHNGYKSFLESYLNLWKQLILIIRQI